MSEYLTMEEIKKRYPDEWVLLENPETNEWMEILGGEVLGHGPEMEEATEGRRDNQPGDIALFYTGTLDPDVAYLL